MPTLRICPSLVMSLYKTCIRSSSMRYFSTGSWLQGASSAFRIMDFGLHVMNSTRFGFNFKMLMSRLRRQITKNGVHSSPQKTPANRWFAMYLRYNFKNATLWIRHAKSVDYGWYKPYTMRRHTVPNWASGSAEEN